MAERLSEIEREYPELVAILGEITNHAAQVLGPSFVGSYLEGSFALGAGDLSSDIDFIVVCSSLIEARQVESLRALHHELPTREGYWTKHVEGSYAQLSDLRDPTAVGRDWLFIDHGHNEMEWDSHGNDVVHRWVLREHGITFAGRTPCEIVAPVTADDLRAAMRSELPKTRAGLDSWCDYSIAWCQRYLVLTYCRQLFTLVTGTVGSKSAGLEWASETLDRRWRPLLSQVLADRQRGFDRADHSAPDGLRESFSFAAYAVTWAAGH